MNKQVAQNQHYVPKFILRNFLSNVVKEQVHVFSKKTKKSFITSIKNIMAERRFHDFRVGDETIASFEGAVGQIEHLVLHSYNEVLTNQCLDKTSEQKAALAAFVAFQMVRTRSYRDQILQLEQQLTDKLTELGVDINKVDGFSPSSEEDLKKLHIDSMRTSLEDFSDLLVAKDFLLMVAPEGRSFYLSDSPVAIHNSQPNLRHYGNLGLACIGIELYVPLSSNLTLAAWCPSLLGKMKEERADQQRLLATAMLSPKMNNPCVKSDFQSQLRESRNISRHLDDLLDGFHEGTPVMLTPENIDFQNSLQIGQSREYVICSQGDFSLARRFSEEFGGESTRYLKLG